MKTHLFTLCAGLLISLSSLVSATACAGSFSESQLQKRETLLAETSADEKARYAAGLTEVLRATEDEREQHRAERGSRQLSGQHPAQHSGQQSDQHPGQRSDQRNPNKPHPRYGEGRNPDFPGSQGTREERQQQMQAMQQQRASQRDAWLQSLTQEERQAFDDATMSEKRAMWRNALRDGWGE